MGFRRGPVERFRLSLDSFWLSSGAWADGRRKTAKFPSLLPFGGEAVDKWHLVGIQTSSK